MPSLLHRQSADIVASDPEEGNIVVVQLAELGEVRNVRDRVGREYREVFDSLEMFDRVHVKDIHHGNVIGHADVNSYRNDPQPTIDLHVADSAAGLDAMALVRNGSTESVSVEFEPGPGDAVDDTGVMRRNPKVAGVAFAFRPAHTAPILATREETEQENTMPEQTEQTPEVTSGDLDELRDTLTREMLTVSAAAGTPVDEYAALREFDTLTDFALATREDPEMSKLMTRALVDQITGNNPGLIPVAWLSNVAGIIARGRPTITAFGAPPIPAEGMDIDWPFYDGDFAALVALQATEKTDINSVLVDIERGTATLATYAGGSDISLQLLRRSSPAYRVSYDAIMAIGYAATSDAAASAQALAAATAGIAWDPAGGTADELKVSLFNASVAVQTATGMPAGFALAASDVFIGIGTLDGLNPAPYGVQNTPGTADAGSLQVNVSGLPVIHDPYAVDGSLIVSNSQAGSWFEDGPQTIEATDVSKLGLNVAIWGLGVFGPVLPAGIVQIPAV